ncbi:phage holin family protein [Neoactinobaculum massilliense]|uniref:phage holin family protein n=1 Tax=Neoactinobaculum massilliense TaxID=2364794 RepID=UPI000F53F0B3|nr:phage holin family protein [Neoactinobaculum massilliense]
MSESTHAAFDGHTYEGSKYTTSNSEEERLARETAPRKRTVGELISAVSAQFSAILRDELNYVKASIIIKVKRLGVGGALLAVVAVLAFNLLTLLLLAVSAAFASLTGSWAWGFLITAAIVLVIMAVLGGIGVAQLKKANTVKVEPGDHLSEDVAAMKKGMES